MPYGEVASLTFAFLIPVVASNLDSTLCSSKWGLRAVKYDLFGLFRPLVRSILLHTMS